MRCWRCGEKTSNVSGIVDILESCFSSKCSRPPAVFSRKLNRMLALLFSWPRVEFWPPSGRFSIIKLCHPCLARNLRVNDFSKGWDYDLDCPLYSSLSPRGFALTFPGPCTIYVDSILGKPHNRSVCLLKRVNELLYSCSLVLNVFPPDIFVKPSKTTPQNQTIETNYPKPPKMFYKPPQTLLQMSQKPLPNLT